MLRNFLNDIIFSITHHKLRTFLTGFGVAWGIFILVLLLGTSSGLEKGMLQLLSGFARNSIWLYGGHSTAEKGKNKYNRAVTFDTSTLHNLKKNYAEQIQFLSQEVQVANQVSYKGKKHHTPVRAVSSDYFHVKILTPQTGRLLNQADDSRGNKVVVIGQQVKEQLFEKKQALGKQLQIGNCFFEVVGILKSGTIFSQSEQNSIFLPYQTAVKSLHAPRTFAVLGLTLKPKCNTAKAEEQIKGYLGKLLSIDPNDTNALYVFNFNQQVKSFQKLFKGLNIFLWFIGICLLLSGMVGVSNIMFVIVNERTREIGIRKAVGAKRKHILWMILFESSAITILAGLLGVLLGSVLLSVIQYAIEKLADGDFLIRDISINWATVLGALFILIFSGMIAGFIPAKKATEIEPIEAMRYD